MRRKYINELFNLATRRQGDNRTADELREVIGKAFSKDWEETQYKKKLKENQRKARQL